MLLNVSTCIVFVKVMWSLCSLFVKVLLSLCSVEHGSEEQPSGHPPVWPADEQPRARAALAAVRSVRPRSAGQCQPGDGHSSLRGRSHHQQLTGHWISAPTSQVRCCYNFHPSTYPPSLPFLQCQSQLDLSCYITGMTTFSRPAIPFPPIPPMP